MLPSRVAQPPAEGRLAVKYAVIGAGYTGLAAARRLWERDPGSEIVVLEATTVGEGSSARNSGFASPRDIPAGPSAAEVQQATAVNRFGEEGFNSLRALIAEHNIACDLEVTGRIKGAATDAGAEVVRRLHATVRQLGLPHVLLDAAAMKARIGSAYYQSGLFTEEGHLLQPAALIRGLAEALPRGVQLHENSPVVALRRQGKWLLETPQAQIRADCVIMATNAAVKHFGYLRDRLVTIHTYAAITDVMAPADAAQLGSMPNWGLLPSHRLGTTVRRVGADRLMVRSLYSYERGIAAGRVSEALRSCFVRRYPTLAHVGLEFVWGGTTALTMNGAPFWGRIDEGLYTSTGCNGAGIVKGTVLGQRLADLVTVGTDEAGVRAAYGSANWIAPEPFRAIGFNVISAIERRKAGRET